MRLALLPPLLAVAATLHAQTPLTLAQAFRQADSAAFQNRAAEGDARARAGDATSALQGILPSIHAEAGWARTDNPLGTFGYILQQRRVDLPSFDPNHLNHPTEVTNWNGGFVAAVPLVNADAWYGRAAANRARSAAQANASWIRQTTRLEVTRAYFGAVLAQERVRTLQTSLAAARAHQKAAESMVSNGLATRSDALLAAVQTGQLQTQLAGAQGQVIMARAQLMLAMGQPDDTALVLPDSLPTVDAILSLETIAGTEPGTRYDLTTARIGLEAARLDVRRSNAQLLPRINGFGRYDWNSPSRPFGGKGSYSIGIMATWSAFAGGSRLGSREAARGAADAARARLEAAEAAAALQVTATRTRLTVALAQLDIARTAVEQTAEAHRIVARKYSGGLATVAELLSAAATETQARLGLADARSQAILAHAEYQQATGGDLMALTRLEN